VLSIYSVFVLLRWDATYWRYAGTHDYNDSLRQKLALEALMQTNTEIQRKEFLIVNN